MRRRTRRLFFKLSVLYLSYTRRNPDAAYLHPCRVEFPSGAAQSAGAVGRFCRPAGSGHPVAGRAAGGGRAGAGVPLLRYNADFCLPRVLPAHRAGSGGGHPQQPPRPQRLYMGHAARHAGAEVCGQGRHDRRCRAGLCRVAACVVHRGVLPRHSAGRLAPPPDVRRGAARRQPV